MDPNSVMDGTYDNDLSGNGFEPDSYSTGAAKIWDHELSRPFAKPTEQHIGQRPGQDFGGGMGDVSIGFAANMYNAQSMDQGQIDGLPETSDREPIQSPFVHNYNQAQLRQMGNFGAAIQSPISYSGSPLAAGGYDLDSRAQLSQSMQAKASATCSPLTAKASPLTTKDSGAFGAQPIQTSGLNKSPGQQWVQTPNSLTSISGSGFPSPIQAGLHHNVISDVIMQKGGASMPDKLGGATAVNTMSSQEIKRKRRRESHNLVERRRRDNINERIHDLGKLVPPHRLEDEKVRKMINNGTPLSPTLARMSGPSQATSSLAGPGARRATSGGGGNITTGLPMEDKDKGPNKGNILNSAVSWTRDLMWMVKRKIDQQEELMNIMAEHGINFPIEFTDDEKRMQSELIDAFERYHDKSLMYSRTAGSGLWVPHHTDIRGEPLNGSGDPARPEAGVSVSPDNSGDAAYEFLNDPDDDGSGPGSLSLKEDDEYVMDLTQ